MKEHQKEENAKRLDRIQKRIEERLGDVKRVVEYSAYAKDREGLPVDNLDEPVIAGRVRFRHAHDEHWGQGDDYESVVFENPKWIDIAVAANCAIVTTGDTHHVFLETVEIFSQEDDVKIVHLGMGS